LTDQQDVTPFFYHALIDCTLYEPIFTYSPINIHPSFKNSHSISHSLLLFYISVYDVNVPPLSFIQRFILFLPRDSRNGQRAMSHFVNLHLLSGCKIVHHSLLLPLDLTLLLLLSLSRIREETNFTLASFSLHLLLLEI